MLNQKGNSLYIRPAQVQLHHICKMTVNATMTINISSEAAGNARVASMDLDISKGSAGNCSMALDIAKTLGESQLALISNTKFWWNTIIIPVGIVGNILCLLVVSQKQNRSISCSVYMGALAVCDTLVLIGKSMQTYVGYVHTLSSLCTAVFYIQFTFSQSGSMIILALLLERVIAVTKPLKATLILSPKRALIITFILIVLMAMFNIPRLFRVYPANAEKMKQQGMSSHDRSNPQHHHCVRQWSSAALWNLHHEPSHSLCCQVI